MNTINPVVRALSLLWLVPKRTLLRRRLTRTVDERVCGRRIRVIPDVFNPVVFRSGKFFAEFLHAEYLPANTGRQLSVLDLGTGSGVLAVVCAAAGHRVTATDVHAKAVECAALNARMHGFEDRIETAHGDLFSPVHGRRFDLILWNPPFFAGRPRSGFDMSWRSEDALDRFAATLRAQLEPGGRALIVWSSQGDTRALLRRLESNALIARALRRAHFGVERFSIYELEPGTR